MKKMLRCANCYLELIEYNFGLENISLVVHGNPSKGAFIKTYGITGFGDHGL